jgi:hypothetical protein
VSGARIQVKRGTAAEWTSANTVLYSGEIGLETDTGKFKIGNGSTVWNSLAYTANSITLNDLGDVTITSAANGDFLRWNGTAWVNDAVNLSTDTIGDYVASLVAGTGVTLSNNSGEGATPTIAIGQAVATSDSPTFAGLTLNGNVVFEGATANEFETTVTVVDPTADRTITIPDVTGTVVTTGDSGTISSAMIANGAIVNEDINANASIALSKLANGTAGYVVLANSSGVPTYTQISGDITISDSGVAAISANAVALGTDTTGNYVAIVSGTTDQVSVVGSGSESASITLSLPQNIATTSSPTFAGVTADNINIGVTGANEIDTVSGGLTIDSATGTTTIDDNLIVTGDLTVQGTTTTFDTQNLVVEDNIVVLNSNVTGSPSMNAGIEIERGDSPNVLVRWNETSDKWEITNDGSAYGNIATLGAIALGTDTTGNYMSDIVAGTGVTITHTPGEGSSASIAIGQSVASSDSPVFAGLSLNGNLSFEGATANEFETTLTVTDPTADRTITLPDASGTVALSGTIALGTDTTGNYVSDVTGGTGVTVTHTPGEGSNPTVAIGQAIGTSDSPTFAGLTINGANIVLEGSTANDFETTITVTDPTADRTITVPDATGTVALLGTIALGADTTGNYMSDVTAGTGISVSHTPGEGSSASISLNASLDNLSDVVITSPEEFQSLSYNGTSWVNSHIPLVSYVRNAEATTLTTGTCVYIFGATGDHATVKRADNTSDATSSKTIGVVGANITASNNGPVITRGYVDGINLSTGYTEGDVLWLNKNGAFTNVKPVSPDHLIFIGVVVRATVNGIIYVATQNGYELDELHNVYLISPTDGQFLRYNSASAQWTNDTINLGADTSGDYVGSLVAGTGVTLSNNSGEGSTPTIAIGQSVATSDSPTFGGLNLNGNIIFEGATANDNETTLTVADPTADRTITLPDASGTVALLGTIALATDTTGSYVASLVAGTGITLTNNSGENATPTVAVDTSTIATRAYVDSAAAGINWHEAVDYATAAVLPNSPTYNNGTSGVGATLTGGSNARLIVDGANASDGDRILVQNQADAKQNGIYVVTTQGSVSVAYVLTRASDADNNIAGQVKAGDAVFVLLGSTHANQGFILTSQGTGTAGAIVLGTDDVVFTQFTGTATLVAGTGMTKTGNTIDIVTANSGRIVVNADSIDLGTVTQTDSSGSATTTFVSGITVDSYGRITGKETSSVSFSSVITKATLTAKGDLISASGASTPSVLAVGTNGYILKANSAQTTGLEWGQLALDDISDVTITSAASGDFLKWNGSAWVNDPINLGTDTVGNYLTDLTAGAGVTITHTPGEGSTATIAIGQSVAASDIPVFAGLTLNGNIVFEGATDNAFETTLTVTDPTNDRTITLPDATTTLVGTDTTQTLTNKTLTSPSISSLYLSDSSIIFEGSSDDTNETTLTVTNPTADRTITIPDVTGTLVTTGDTGSVTSTMIADGTIVNDDINASAAIALSKLATGTGGYVVLANSSGVPTYTQITGDISITDAGVVSIAANAVALGTDTSGNYVATIAGTTDQISVSGSGSETAAVTLSLPQNIATTSSPTFAGATLDAVQIGVTAAGEIDTSTGNLTIDSAGGTVTVDDNLVVSGNLTVNGTTVTVNSTTTTLDDPIITLGGDTAPVSDDGKDRGVEFNWHNGTAAKVGFFGFDDSSGKFTFIPDATNTSEVFSGTLGTIDVGAVHINGSQIAASNLSNGTTGSGSIVLASSPTIATATLSSPTMTTPSLGVASATSINKVAITAPATGSTLTIADGKTLTANNTLTLTGTDSSSVSFGAGGTVAYVADKLSVFAATSSSELAGVISDETGSGALVFGTSPTIATPTLTLSTTTSTTAGRVAYDSTGFKIIVGDGTTAREYASSTVVTNAQTSSYTTVLGDKDKLIEMNVASGNTLTIPPNSSVAYPVGTQIRILQVGAGQTTLTPGAGVTINGTPGLKLRAQWSSATLIKRATDTWVAVGDLSA